MPTRVYRYIAKEVIFPFIGSFLFFMLVFLMFQIVRLADYFINHGVGPVLLAKITLYICAAFLPVVIPISFLVATLVGFGRMSADSEIIALKASGISIGQMYIPVAIFSIIVSACILYLTNFYIPWGNYQFKRTIVKLGETKVVAKLKEGTFTEGFFDLLIYADRVDMKKNKLEGVFIYDERDLKNPMVVTAKDGVVIPVKTESEFSSAIILKLDKGSIHRSEIERKYYEKIDFKEYRLLLEVEEGDSGEIAYPKTLISPKLKGQMKKYKGNYKRYQEYAVEYWKRWALGITPIIFGLLGIGLGVIRARSVKSYAVFVACAVVVLYWGLTIVGSSLAESAVLPPFLAMQICNIVIIPFALISFKRSMW